VVVTSEPVQAANLLDWCSGRIPAFAIPRYLRIVEALPKTPSEKVRKAALREDGVTVDTYDRTSTQERSL
jgi:crotonobetaine/carnitine-CoA ligase